MASQQRPLLIPSPRTEGFQELPYTPIFADQLKLSTENPKQSSDMDANSQIDNFPVHENITLSSLSNSSYRSKASGRNSIREVNFGGNSVREMNSGELGLGMKPRHGSRAESEGLSISQREINDEDARLIYIDDPEKTNERFEFTGNSIRTGKYSIITFLPRNLFEQFHRVAYIYFLVIAILNQLPQLAVFGRGVSILPLAVVLLVTAVKDAYEDFRRHRSDKIENNRLAWVLVNDSFVEKKWRDIRVGEIIKISANDTLPCDMVLLSTSDSTGVAYVQTINLDGESNLKTRYAKQETQLKNPEKDKISGLMKCEKPNRNIYGFQANMEIDGKRVSLGPSNIILRGCELKNTSWAIGVAVYAGRETKVMLNNSGAPSKRSRLETRMNREIIILSFFLVGLCTIVCICAGIWLRRNKDKLNTLLFYRKKRYTDDGQERDYNYYGMGMEIVFTFLMSVIVFQVMIPISLYISMELVRVGQAYFMIRDKNLYDASSNSRFQCRALNINEDLGQIKYVFSDKTGTLTENKMEFQCASIWGVNYAGGKTSHQEEQVEYSVQGFILFNTSFIYLIIILRKNILIADVSSTTLFFCFAEDSQVLKPKLKVKIDPDLLNMVRNGKHTDEGRRVWDFFFALAACNTIVPLAVETSDPSVRLIDYQGESPDEQALVYAAAAYGFMLIERTSGHILIDVQGERQR